MLYNANLYKVGVMNSQRHGGQRSTSVTFSTPEIPWAGLQTAFTADYVLGISIYIHAMARSFWPLLDSSAIRGKNMKHSDYNKGTAPTTGDVRPVYTTVAWLLPTSFYPPIATPESVSNM